jgi:hypothetical protein
LQRLRRGIDEVAALLHAEIDIRAHLECVTLVAQVREIFTKKILPLAHDLLPADCCSDTYVDLCNTARSLDRSPSHGETSRAASPPLPYDDVHGE